MLAATTAGSTDESTTGVFQVLKEAPRPDELGAKTGEADRDDDESWTRQDDQCDADRKHR